MPHGVLYEIQRVRAVRKVEAADAAQAWVRFCQGDGEPAGDDGDVISSELVSITEVA